MLRHVKCLSEHQHQTRDHLNEKRERERVILICKSKTSKNLSYLKRTIDHWTLLL